MLICAIDTSGRNGSLALVRYAGEPASAHIEAGRFEVVEFAPLKGGEYSAELIPTLGRALEKHGLAKSAIDLFAVASGPGSFTGLRVGLSTVKALGDALQKPIVAVSVLEAVALASKEQGKVIAALDAQRGEVFAGEYEVTPATWPLHTEHEALSSVDDFCTWLSARVPVPVTYTPDVAIAEKVTKSGSPAELLSRPAADVYARAGMMKFAAGQTVTAEALDANYIRRSDAEIFSKK